MKRYAFFIAVFAFFILTQGAFAFIARTGEQVLISSDELITEDLYIAGEEIEIDGTVNAAVFAAARKVTLRGTVKKQMVVFAQEVTIQGNVGGGLKIFAQNITVNTRIDGDVMLFGARINLDEATRVSGDTLFGGRHITVNGSLKKDVLGAGQGITLNGTVDGNAKLAVQELRLTESARIRGNLKYYSENEAQIEKGARIEGSITHHLPEFRDRLKKIFPFVLLAGIVGKIVEFFIFAALGLVFILITPVWMRSLSDAIAQKPGACAGWGALLLFVAPIAIAVAFSTVIGIAVAGIALLLYLVALFISQIAVSLIIGRLIIGLERSGQSKGMLFGAFLLGLFILRLIRFIPVFGYIVLLVCGIFGMGAIVVAEAARRRAHGADSL
jgi:cytoskeletal protein CcmA (bactofilin family)